MKFGQLASLATPTKTPDRVIPAYHAYIMGDRNLRKEAEALTYILTKNEERVATGERDRTKSWSASSAGSCMRAQQFNYLGFGGMAPDERAQSIFLNGDYLHLRWQVAGLVAGWLADAEVPLRHEGRVRGTMDGDLAWGEVLELKSINGRGYEQVVEFGPKEAHKWQGTAYCLCTGYSTVRFVYENKNTQDAVEFAWSPDEEWRAKVLERWSLLNEATDEKRLIPMLHPCLSEKGDAYRWCDFRKICDGAEFPKKVTLK